MDRPKVGVGVMILKDGKVLLGKRKNAHGDGCWAFPGGHLEFMESWEDCAKREVEEETGLKIDNVGFLTATNDLFEEENRHYITCFVGCEVVEGEPKIMEPEKCDEWAWFDWDNLPEPLFVPLRNLKRSGFRPDKL